MSKTKNNKTKTNTTNRTNHTKTTSESLDLKRRLQEATALERAILLDGLDYEVGFGKPPRSTQFKPGQSGNPRGRPRGSKNFMTMFTEELGAPIVVTVDGKRCKVPKWQVAVRQQVNKAVAEKDTKAFTVIADLARTTGQLQSAPTAQAHPIEPRDLAAVAALRALYDESIPEGDVAGDTAGDEGESDEGLRS